jgi:RHS repeat-associated protein
MSVYEAGKSSVNDGHLTQTELHLYGSSRLGLLRRSLDVDIVPAGPDPYKITMPIFGEGDSIPFARGNKLFELSNHLGNVLVTVNDKKLGVSSNNGTIDYFNPQVASAQDYYPFGMLQVGRSYNAGGYRFGFNGKENDNEVKGEGEQQDYGMRVYDPRLGRFLSVDPLTGTYPWYTPYQYAGNDPINYIDIDGLEPPDAPATQVHTSTQPKSGFVTKEFLDEKRSGSIYKPTKPTPKPPKPSIKPRGGTGIISIVSQVVTHYLDIKIEEAEAKYDQLKNFQDNLYGGAMKRSKGGILASLSIHNTEDHSQIPDEYLAEVEKRIKDGTATIQDYQYQDEIARRKKAAGPQTPNTVNDKTTFTPLTASEIETLQERFGEGDPDFIEKIKKPGGKGVGKVDLYRNDKSGEIVVIPKAQKNKNEGGETTGYNTKDLQ